MLYQPMSIYIFTSKEGIALTREKVLQDNASGLSNEVQEFVN